MEPTTVLLISANDLLWTGVHVALQSVSDVMIVDDVTDRDLAAERARELQPQVVVTGLTFGGRSMLPVLAEVRAGCPTSKILVLAERFTLNELLALGELGVVGYWLWRDLDFSTLRACMGAAIGGDFFVLSRPAAEQLLSRRRGTGDAENLPVSLSEREQKVLRGLAAGLTQEEIARSEQLSLRTVKRISAGLGTKLDAPSAFVLGAKARDLGLIPSFTAKPAPTGAVDDRMPIALAR